VSHDFCHQVRRTLVGHGREADYVEVGLEGPWRFNPLHNELDSYALAYGIASLLNNVFGKGKEPARSTRTCWPSGLPTLTVGSHGSLAA